MADVDQLVQQNLVSSVHARITFVFMEVFALAFQAVVILNALCLFLHFCFELTLTLDLGKLSLMVRETPKRY